MNRPIPIHMWNLFLIIRVLLRRRPLNRLIPMTQDRLAEIVEAVADVVYIGIGGILHDVNERVAEDILLLSTVVLPG